ncbi:RNA polymerase primary sigma factor [Lachnospiraceae bacterium XBB2008]|nr:RNA polymerase primary sigma factor [Lachnospiraceae bacterium XBB2008]
MNRDAEFAGILKKLVELGRDNDNFLEASVVDEAFASMQLQPGQLEMIYEYLRSNHVGVGEPLKDSDYLESEEIDYLNMYLEDLKALPSFSEGEKEAVTISAMAGDVDAQSRLIEMHLENVVELAKLYAGQGVFLEDLIGEGNVALSLGVTMLGALEHESEADGMLTRMIMDGMEECIADHAEMTKQDEKSAKSVNDVADKARELAEELGRKVTIEELMQETGFTRNAIQRALVFSGGKIEDIDSDPK